MPFDKTTIREISQELLMEEGFITKQVRTPCLLNLRHLKVQRISLTPIAADPTYQLRVGATIVNIGDVISRDCDVAAEIDLLSDNRTERLRVRCPALKPRTSHRVELGVLQGLSMGQCANVRVVVQPPIRERPGGEVWESDETGRP